MTKQEHKANGSKVFSNIDTNGNIHWFATWRGQDSNQIWSSEGPAWAYLDSCEAAEKLRS